jgi:hypothetical protein
MRFPERTVEPIFVDQFLFVEITAACCVSANRALGLPMERQALSGRLSGIWSAKIRCKSEDLQPRTMFAFLRRRFLRRLSRRDCEPAPPVVSSSVRTAAGVRMYIDPLDQRGGQLLQSGGNLNPEAVAIWHRLLSEGAWTHVVDVGAN